MIFWEKQKVMTALYEAITKPVCEKYGLTRMEYDIVMFLHNNSQYKTASDIVKMRRLTKSHVSTGIKLLEEKGYILKYHTDDNRKNLILQLSNKSKVLIEEGENAQNLYGKTIFSGFTDSEMETCREMFSRMCENANKALTGK